MKQDKQQILERIIIIAIVIAPLLFIYNFTNKEVNFCRSVFNGLIKGSYFVHRHIDWRNFKALDVDIGKAFLQLPNEYERTNYKKAFIKSFSIGFQNTGAKFSSFSNWRIFSRDKASLIIAAENRLKGKTLLFVISKSAKQRLLGLQLVDTASLQAGEQ